MPFYVINSHEQRRAITLGVCATLDEAKDVARSDTSFPYGRWILDSERGRALDWQGRRSTLRNLLAERLLHALRTGVYARGSELVGIEEPGVTPAWTRTAWEHHVHATRNDDLFSPSEEHEDSAHKDVVRMAMALGKPVPSRVLASVGIKDTLAIPAAHDPTLEPRLI